MSESLQVQYLFIEKALNAPYAKDIKLNLSSLLAGADPVGLSKTQIAALALAAAYATQHSFLIQYFTAYACEQGLDEQAIRGAQTAAALMAMNNVYYRSVHMIQGNTYSRLPVKLRMNQLQQHGMNQQEFELYCVVVSAMNGCGRCLEAHVTVLEKAGMSTAQIQYGLRMAAVIQAVAQVVVMESSVNGSETS